MAFLNLIRFAWIILDLKFKRSWPVLSFILFLFFFFIFIVFENFLHIQRLGWLSATNRVIPIFQEIKNKEIECNGFGVISTTPDFGMLFIDNICVQRGNVSVIVVIFRQAEETYIMVWFVIVSPESFMVKSSFTFPNDNMCFTYVARTFKFKQRPDNICIYSHLHCYQMKLLCQNSNHDGWKLIMSTYIVHGQHVPKKPNEKNSNQIINDVVSICLFKRICCSFKYLSDPYSKSFLFYVHKRPMVGQAKFMRFSMKFLPLRWINEMKKKLSEFFFLLLPMEQQK